MAKPPVYFFAHGGPSLIDQTTHPAYHQLQRLGKEIVTQVKPKAVVVISAHWGAGPSTIQVNSGESSDMIYDFSGFPSHYYKMKLPNKGSPQLSQHIVDLLRNAGLRAETVKRGFDHGVFVSFLVAFKDNPLEVPLVQVSLYDNEDPNAHYKLGEALAPLRDEGVAIIGSGMVVHNLRDFRFGSRPGGLRYADTFDAAVKEATEADVGSREQAMAELLKHKDARSANPTFEHVLPLHVAAGAAENDVGKQISTLVEGPLSWAMYRFGEVAA